MPNQLERTCIHAAKNARELLRELVVEAEARGAATALSAIVGRLFEVEVQRQDKLLTSLDWSMKELKNLHTGAMQQGCGDTLERCLVLLYPASSALRRSLRGEKSAPATQLTSAESRPPKQGKERKRARTYFETEVGIEGPNNFFTGSTGDLSGGGLFIATDVPFMVGTSLSLSFVLPDGHHVVAKGRVAWVRAPRYREHELPAGMGIRFEALFPKDQESILRFIELRAPIRWGA